VFSGKLFITQKAKPNIKSDLVEAILQGLFYSRNIEKSLANTAFSKPNDRNTPIDQTSLTKIL